MSSNPVTTEGLLQGINHDPLFQAILEVVRGSIREGWLANPLAWYEPFPHKVGEETWDIVVYLHMWEGIDEELRKRVCFTVKVDGTVVFIKLNDGRVWSVADLTHPKSLGRVRREVLRTVEMLEAVVVDIVGSQKRLAQLKKNQPHKVKRRLRGRKRF